MSSKRSPIRSYALIILLCFLIVKLGLTTIFVCTKNPVLSAPIWESAAALAKDDKASHTKNRTSGSPPDTASQVPPDAPDLTELQKEIVSLEAHLKGINQDIDKYFKAGAPKTVISPETLEQKRAQLEKEGERLKEERKRIEALKQELDEKFVKLTKIQDAIQSKLDEKKILQDKRIKHLIKIYTTMPPKKAAALIEKLEMEIIIAVLSKMKGENVGQILPYVPPEKAAAISERLAKLGS